MNILKKLTLKSLILNKSRTIMTIIGITLAVALITIVACLAASARQSVINYSVQSTGDYDAYVGGTYSHEDMEKLRLNRNVENVYEVNYIGIAPFDSKSNYHKNVSIIGVQRDAFENCFGCRLSEGRYPENGNEVILTRHFLKYSTKEYKVGDNIDLGVGVYYIDSDGQKFYLDYTTAGYMTDNDSFEKKADKSYKIVGILDYMSGSIDVSVYQMAAAYTVVDPACEAYGDKALGYTYSYIKLTKDAESNYRSSLGDIVGLSKNEFGELFENTNQDISQEQRDQLVQKLLKNEFKIAFLELNNTYLSAKGIKTDPAQQALTVSVLILIFSIIILCSVFIIRNSFAISITEKTKLYGMLSSVGATPAQIRKNVFFEGFVMGAVGIPLGLLLGIGGAWGLAALSNNLLSDDLFGVKIAFSVSLEAMVLAVILGVLTIFLSSEVPARRASKIPPIEAIRSNQDIKTEKKKKKSGGYKTPKLVSKLFGAGGSIAWKNLKRSKRQYRTTVISIVVSVAAYLTVSSFVTFIFGYTSSYFDAMDYELSFHGAIYDEVWKTEIGEDGSEYDYGYSFMNFEKTKELYDRLSEIDGIEKSIYCFGVWDNSFDITKDMISDELFEYDSTSLYDFSGATTTKASCSVVGVNDKVFAELAEKSGTTVEKAKDKAILLNTNTAYKLVNDKYEYVYGRFMQDPVGKTFKMSNYLEEADYSEFKSIEKNFDLEICGEISDRDYLKHFTNTTLEANGIFVVSVDKFRSIFTEDISYGGCFMLHAEDPDTAAISIEDAVESSKDTVEGYYLMNYSREKRMLDALVLVVQIFVYGFIGIITMIGITNIFNTITTNMSRRKREFAMLQSVGMTKYEFDRMIALESIFYTLKSLLYGIPIGIIGSYILYLLSSPGRQMTDFVFYVPWQSILISILSVLIIIWVIMSFSIRKVRKQNIIETIRNENN